jgi:hypothetical protein
MGSLAPQGIFQSDGILHFALNLTSFAFACELPVAGYLSNYLSNDFFHLALGAQHSDRSLSTIMDPNSLSAVDNSLSAVEI